MSSLGVDRRLFPVPQKDAKPTAADEGVTVVIPAFHMKDRIQRAVESVAQQRGVETEIIVIIDDGCAETRERVEQLALSGCRVVMNDRNLGAQVTRNRGLAEASKPYVMFLDGDDFLSGDLLRGLLEAGRRSDADLVLGPWRTLTSEGKLLPIQVPKPAPVGEVFWRWLVHGRWVSPTAVLWRTEYVRSIGGWDVRLRRHQDAEIALRAMVCGARLAFSNKGAGVYVQHESEHRVTRSTNYDSQLDVAEFLLETDGPMPEATRRAAVSRYLYRMAVQAFRRGDDDFGMKALDRSRHLGFRGHLGRIARVGSMLLGTRRYNRLVPKIRRRLSLFQTSLRLPNISEG